MENRYFQYLMGDNSGQVVLFDKIEEEDGEIFICFKNGSRCKEEWILPLGDTQWRNHIMAEVDDPSNLWTMKEEWVGRQEEKRAKDANGISQIVIPFYEGKKKITPIPPKPSKSKFGNISKFEPTVSIDHTDLGVDKIMQSKEQQNSNDNGSIFKSDPVYIMMEKSKKFPLDIEMTISINLPSKSLYNVAKESFEDGGEKVLKYIIENLDITEIKSQLANSLRASYEESSNSNFSEDKIIHMDK